MRSALVVSAGLSLASIALVAPAPGYDPWTWLLWGREVAGLELDTREGPAFKPLPVAVCALLAPLGSAAPWLWVALARAGALMGVVLAYAITRELANGSRTAGALAGAGVAATGAYLANAASGQAEGLLVGLVLAAWAAWRARRPRLAAACLLAAGLLRVETWPFLVALALVAARRFPRARPWLAAGALAVPVAWFGPEWLGSGDALRSGTRAMVPNPGQPALADVPAAASLRAALSQPPAVVWLGLAAAVVAGLVPRARRFRAGSTGSDRPGREAAAPRSALRHTVRGRLAGPRAAPATWVTAGGLAWIALVAVMAQAGFSGEPRYALPGAALLAIPGALGVAAALERLSPAPASAVLTALALIVLAPGLTRAAPLVEAQAYQARLAGDLDRAIAAAGGRAVVLACGTPHVGPLRGPLLAHRLGVAKRRVEPDEPPTRGGVVFRSALTRHHRVSPDAPAGYGTPLRIGLWEVRASCGAERARSDHV